ncbi:asparagine synthase-related protein [Streptomyces lydicus]|uniref:asparagine synthase-related protein n=1 Tax=Streptomyces lydicus TaxID=47763 RepID=UPI0010131C80|nr:asparagine synthase-related protein [Streptomyces lydicus]MCZ1012207.1 asparagine synthase-related protein [Streptomyces lydicus]
MTCTAEWFVVLPGNSSAAQRATARFQAIDSGVQILARREGRPWIIGRSARTLVAVHAAGGSAALLGTHEGGEQELADALSPGDPIGTVVALMRGAGSYHAVLATGSGTWVCGDVAGMRPVFWARVDGAVVFGDHARLLAEAAGTVRVDPSHLAMHLLGPVPPLALTESGSSPYEGVRAVPPGSVGYVEGSQAVAVRRWWTAPDDERALPEAAPVLRDALRRAVAVRTRGEPLVGCELSGGADSTALSALAYEEVGGERLANFTRAPADPANDDTDWARLAAASQPGASHDIFEVGAVPPQFAGMDAPFVLDAPSPSAASPLRSAFWWRHAAGTGVRTLLSGKGGDELTLTALPYLSYTRRRDRHTARQHMKGWAALWGSSVRQVRLQAVAPMPYAAWLAGCLTRKDESFGWEAGPHVPPWLTASARTVLADAVSTAADAAEPLHDRPHQHTAMAAIRALARWNRLQADAAAPFGIRIGYPYADQQVIEAALSTRAEARTSPYQNKPLLTAAMRGIVPATYLARRTKGGYSADTTAAAAAMRQTFARLLDADCRLASYGLIDPDRLRAALTSWDRADERTDLLLHLTVMCEIWARTADNHPLPTLDSPVEARC